MSLLIIDALFSLLLVYIVSTSSQHQQVKDNQILPEGKPGYCFNRNMHADEDDILEEEKQKCDIGIPQVLSGFFRFCQDERPKIKAENPDISLGDIAKELSRRWTDFEPKSKYTSVSRQEKEQFEKGYPASTTSTSRSN